MRILVSGATGNVGGALVKQLADADVAVRAVSRRPADAGLPDGVEVVFGDADRPDTIAAAAQDADAAFVMTAGKDSGALRALADAGVRRVVYLSALTVQTRPGFPIGAWQEAAELDLRRLLPESTILRPGQFTSNTLAWRKMVGSGTIYAPFPDVATLMIDPYDIAAVARAVLLDPSGRYLGAAYGLTGAELITTRRRVEILGEVLDRDLQVVEIDRTAARSQMPLPEALADAALELSANPNAAETEILPAVQEILGREPHTFADWVRANRHHFD
ncbi:NmrA family transcriptional regulator [Microlunatus endophyticus]|uniref:NmrA family transcriptional regulator n=1 Tax=Microlunatus endophyticus TaxID=1716077 RepID=A0A917S3U0_9ACTN|nr:NAD(P)H-binding protein [Microlunatus endophyticus]GGL55073.1 NmrA family transcriptional regulator [Microlunatus endophyticus]